MRAFVLSGVATLACSGVAFFAGARSGLLREAPPAADCQPSGLVPAAASSPPSAPSVSSAASAKPVAPPAIDPDEAEWPHRSWKVADEGGVQLHSKVRFLWIRPEPRRTTTFLGYLSLGDSVRLKGGSKEAAFAGKSRSVSCHSWYAVLPRGYVCVSDDNATFDAGDATFAELARRRADRRSPWPYKYAESTGTPVYASIPPRHLQRRNEAMLDDHLRNVRAARQAGGEAEMAAIDPTLVGVDVKPAGAEPPPMFLLGPEGRTLKTKVVRGSTIAFTDWFDAGGRAWLLTWDRGVVPKDRVKPYPASRFHGVELTDTVKLPIAFFHRRVPQYRLGDKGPEPTGKHWQRHGFAMVTEERVDHGGERYVVTRDGLLSPVHGISVARRSHAIPPRIEQMDQGRRTWIDVSVLGGWLVAYEYDKPVYATLVSPGRGGVPKHGVPPLDTASTPVGRFRITGKFVTATMVSNASKDIVHDEVMYTQNFTGPYALHGAYWHDEWGEKKSGGCLNLSPVDARRLFAWTEPRLPDGWHAVQLVTGYEGALDEYRRATLVYTHK